MVLDVRTFLVLSAVFIGMTGVCLTVVAAHFPPPYRRSAGTWTQASLLFALGSGLTAVQDLLPELIRIVFGNLAYLLAAALLYQSLRRFDGLRLGPKAYRAIVLPAMALVLAGRFAFDHYNFRVLVMALALIALLGLSAHHLLRHAPSAPRRGARAVVAACFGLNMLVMVVRIGVALATWNAPAPMLDDGPLPSVYLMLSSFALLGLVFSYLVLAAGQVTNQLSAEANSDALTGLLNRRAFEVRAAALLERDLAAGIAATLLLIDGDRFKQINDTFGHHAGDEALCAIGQTLAATLRQKDLIARLGGDEFAVLLQGATLAQARVVEDRLTSALEQRPFGYPARLSISVGAAQQTASCSSLAALLVQADRDLYRAKASGAHASARVPSWAPVS